MEKHLECLEKPLSLNDTHLYHTYITCRNLGLVINNYLFKKMPNRTVENDYWNGSINSIFVSILEAGIIHCLFSKLIYS